MVESFPIVLFDGVCNYCNWMVNFAIRNDKKAALKFAPLQSEIGTKLRKEYNIGDDIDSLIFIDKNKAHIYADAALGVAKYLNYPAKLLTVFSILPSFICNSVYKWIAKNRYKWFGQKDSCMMPTKEVKERFL